MNRISENKLEKQMERINRKTDIYVIKQFLSDKKKNVFNKPVKSIDRFVENLDDKIYPHIQETDDIAFDLVGKDLNKLSTESLRNFAERIKKVNTTHNEISEVDGLLNKKHSTNEYWDITWHMLSDLLYNIPILIKKRTGLPGYFYAKGRKEFPKDEKKAWKRASELYDRELENVLLYIRLYQYYSSYGIVDRKCRNMAKIDKEYRKTIPLESNGDINYAELDKLKKKYWNMIWTWVKKWGQCIWD